MARTATYRGWNRRRGVHLHRTWKHKGTKVQANRFPSAPARTGFSHQPPELRYDRAMSDAVCDTAKEEGAMTRICQNFSSLLLYNCRSEEHTSELQSLRHLVCRLLL